MDSISIEFERAELEQLDMALLLQIMDDQRNLATMKRASSRALTSETVAEIHGRVQQLESIRQRLRVAMMQTAGGAK